MCIRDRSRSALRLVGHSSGDARSERMKAIILADNDRRELRPLNSRKPGALIKINGIPLLEHQIRSYLKAGVAEASITVVSGYRHNAIKRFLLRAYPAVHLVKNASYRSKNVARSLHLALQTAEFDGVDLMVSSGDCIYDDHLIKTLLWSNTNAVAGDTVRSGGEAILVPVSYTHLTLPTILRV